MPLSAIPQIAQIPGLQAALDAKAAQTAVDSALALKAPLASPTLTGAVTINGGTITAAGTPLTIQQTWNNGAIAFGGLVLDITDTASDAASSLLDLSVGGSKKFLVGKTGALTMRDVLRIIAGTLTANAPSFDLSQTWNNAAVNFTAANVNVTNTASGSASKLFQLQVDSSTRFFVDKNGVPNVGNLGATNTLIKSITNGAGLEYVYSGDGTVALIGEGGIRALCARNGSYISAGSTTPIGWSSITVPGAFPIDTAISRSQAGVVEFNNGIAGTLRDWLARRGSLSEYLDVSEMTAPAAPGANTARLYCDDSGGKSRLMVRFPSGAAQQLAIEP